MSNSKKYPGYIECLIGGGGRVLTNPYNISNIELIESGVLDSGGRVCNLYEYTYKYDDKLNLTIKNQLYVKGNLYDMVELAKKERAKPGYKDPIS